MTIYLWNSTKDGLRIKAKNDREKAKYKMQPDYIIKLIEMYPENQFRIYPNIIRCQIKEKIDTEELKKLIELEKPKFTGIGIEYSGGMYGSNCYGDMVFEPVSYYSDAGKFIEVKK